MGEIQIICPVIQCEDGFINCKMEQCAWWMKVEQKCAIPVIARNLDALGIIADK